MLAVIPEPPAYSSVVQLVRSRYGISAVACRELSLRLCQCLAGLHGAEVVHRDIKPDHVLVPPNVKAVLTDKGYVRTRISP